MRTIILVLLSFLLSSQLTNAQSQFNIKGGINLTQAVEDFEDGEIDGKAGYQFGVEARFGDRFYVSPGLYYFNHQSRITYFEGISPVNLPDYKVTFEGLRVPLFIGGDLIKGENWGLRIFTGPNASFVFSTNDGVHGYEDDAFQDILWGFNAGVGADLGIFTIDISREWRLNNVFDEEPPSFRDHIAYLTLGLLF